MIRSGLVLGLFLVVLAPSIASAQTLPTVRKQPCTVITSVPYTVTAPGNYCLGADHVISTQQGIWIASSDVDMDCKGHAITKTPRGGENTIGVLTSSLLVNVTVRNCRINNFEQGLVGGSEGRNFRVLNNWVDGAVRVGISAAGQGVQVVGNRVSNTHYYDDTGLEIASIAVFPYGNVVTTGQVIRNNVVIGAQNAYSHQGISVLGSSAPLIEGNQILDLRPPAGLGGATAIGVYDWDLPTSGAVVIRNTVMSRWSEVRALEGVAALCNDNVAIGTYANAFVSCDVGARNIVIP